MICEREGCNRNAPVDRYCSRICAQLASGTVTAEQVAKQRREYYNQRRRVERLRKKHGDYVSVDNPDAFEHRLDGAYETGKRR